MKSGPCAARSEKRARPKERDEEGAGAQPDLEARAGQARDGHGAGGAGRGGPVG